jgi:hypothetical protein
VSPPKLISRAEEITSEVRRLALTCRKLEAELARSVPKKAHEEAVAKMQQKIDCLNIELTHARSDIEKSISMNEELAALGKMVSTQGEKMGVQNELIKAISTKLDGTVPSPLYEQATAKIRELEESVAATNKEFGTLEARNRELEAKILQMVPQDQLASLQKELSNALPKEKYEEEIQRICAETVSKEQYSRAESRIAELESELANSVPKAEFEELSSSIITLAKSAPVLNGREFVSEENAGLEKVAAN